MFFYKNNFTSLFFLFLTLILFNFFLSPLSSAQTETKNLIKPELNKSAVAGNKKNSSIILINRCGNNWHDANDNCGNPSCTDRAICKRAGFLECYGGLDNPCNTRIKIKIDPKLKGCVNRMGLPWKYPKGSWTYRCKGCDVKGSISKCSTIVQLKSGEKYKCEADPPGADISRWCKRTKGAFSLPDGVVSSSCWQKVVDN